MGKKILTKIIFTVIMAMLLAGCNDKCEGGIKETHSHVGQTEKAEKEPSVGEENESVSDDNDDKKLPSDKKEAEFIKKYLSKINVEERNYSLFYLNDDDVPEFAVYGDGTIHNGLVDLYTLEEGEIIKLGRYGSYDSVYYKEREGVLVEEYDGTSGSFYTNIYKMEKGQIVVVEKFEVKCWDEDKTYFVNGEETYVSRKKKYRDNLSIVGAS